jgi:hypothetical protein
MRLGVRVGPIWFFTPGRRRRYYRPRRTTPANGRQVLNGAIASVVIVGGLLIWAKAAQPSPPSECQTIDSAYQLWLNTTGGVSNLTILESTEQFKSAVDPYTDAAARKLDTQLGTLETALSAAGATPAGQAQALAAARTMRATADQYTSCH